MAFFGVQRDISSLRSQRLQRAYNWEIILPTLLPMFGEMVSPLVQSVSYSDYEMAGPFTLKDGAFQSNFVNHLTKRDFSITFLENEFGFVKLYLSSWKNKMLDRHGMWKNKIGGYAKDIVLLYLTVDGLPLRELKFVNAFPLKFYEATLDYNVGDVLKITIPFACDRVEEGLIGTVGGVSSSQSGLQLTGNMPLPGTV